LGRIPPEYLPPRGAWPERVYTLPELRAYPQHLNSTEELLDRHVAEGRGDRAAILFEDQRITYAALAAQVNRLAGALRGLGIEEEDRVLLRAPSIPPALVANFAVIRLGAVIVPISPLFSRAEIAHVASNTEASALFVAAPLLEEVERARALLATVRHVIVIGGDAAEIRAKGFIPYADLMSREYGPVEPVRRDRLAVSVLLFTSGTTGLPKGTAHVMEEALVVPDTFGRHGWRVTPDDVIGGPAPLSVAAGYSTQAVIPFRFGAAASLLPRFTPEAMFEQIGKHRITIVSILPTAYRKMLQVPDARARYDLSSVRLCTGGGESLGAETYQAWKDAFGLEIFEGLGTTEMMYVFVSSAVTRRVKPGAIGPAVPGYELRVISEGGKDCRPGEVGLLVVKGPTGTLYWRDPAARGARIAGPARSGSLSSRARPARSTGAIPTSRGAPSARAGALPATSSPWTRRATSPSCRERTTSSSRRAIVSGPRRSRASSLGTPPWPTAASSASRTRCAGRTRAPMSR